MIFPWILTDSKTMVAATVEPREKFIVLDLMTKKVSLYDVPYPEEVIRKHIIKSLAILPDERHVIFSIRFDNDIRFLDVSTMKEDRVIKGIFYYFYMIPIVYYHNIYHLCIFTNNPTCYVWIWLYMYSMSVNTFSTLFY